ncbi:hypothetical protein Nmel_006026 [Mimus melanotis]
MGVSGGSYWQNCVKVREGSIAWWGRRVTACVGWEVPEEWERREEPQRMQTENKGADDEVVGIISPVLHPELQFCCSILCSSGINVFG